MRRRSPKHFVRLGDCIRNPFETLEKLQQVIADAKEITKQTFMKHCESYKMLLDEMKRFPHDYTFYKSLFEGHVIYFFEFSRVEHFYADEREIDWSSY